MTDIITLMEEKRKKLDKEYISSSDKTDITESSLKKLQDYAFSSNALPYRAHVYCVFNDPDFQKDIADLRQKFETLYYQDISLSTSYYDEHILPEDRPLIKDVADKYRINLDDLGFYADGSFQQGYIGFGKDIVEEGGFKITHPSETEGMPVYVIGRYTTLEDIRKEWPYIMSMTALWRLHDPDGLSRKRSLNNPKLIYSIFRARMQGMTFNKIFSLYEAGVLLDDQSNKTQYSNEDSLERYYRKYAPKLPNNEVVLSKVMLDAIHKFY